MRSGWVFDSWVRELLRELGVQQGYIYHEQRGTWGKQSTAWKFRDLFARRRDRLTGLRDSHSKKDLPRLAQGKHTSFNWLMKNHFFFRPSQLPDRRPAALKCHHVNYISSSPPQSPGFSPRKEVVPAKE